MRKSFPVVPEFVMLPVRVALELYMIRGALMLAESVKAVGV